MIDDLLARLDDLGAEIKSIRRELSRFNDVKPRLRRRGAPRTSDEWAPRAIELYGQGLSVLAVAKEVGSTSPTVLKVLIRAGVKRRRPGGAMSNKTAERNKALVDAYEANGDRNIAALGRTFGISRERARQVLVNAGIDTDGGGSVAARAREARHAEIKRLWDEGKTPAQIGAAVGVSTYTALNAMKEMGYTVEKRGRVTAKTRRALMMFRSGTSVAEITKALGYSSESVCRATLHRYGESDQIRAIREAAAA